MRGELAAAEMAAEPQTVGALAARAGVSFGTSGLRGLVSDFTPDLCHAYVQAFLGIAEPRAKRLLIGHDLRPSSPGIAGLCHQAARQAGWDTCHAGAVPTPALAYAAQEMGLPAVMVTGSHIPFDRNGIKFYHSHGEITKADEQAMLSAPLPEVPPGPAAMLPEADNGIIRLYLGRYLDVFPNGSLSGLRIGVFEHSSVARDLIYTVLQSLGAETVSLGRSDDFVAVDTEAVRPEDIAIAPVWAAAHALDAIVTTDGDADRPLIADEHGRWLRGDMLGILCARELGARSVVTPVSSNTALEASNLFPHVRRTRIGSPHVIAAMAACADQPVVGYEANGGFLLGSDVALGGKSLRPLRTRDALLPVLLMLTAARRRGVALSALSAGLPARHTASDRLREIDSAASQRLLARIKDDPQALHALLAPDAGTVQSIDRTDGLRVTFANGAIVHLRPSGNAPELRCYAEAAGLEEAERLCRECLSRISSELG
jgi:phosphomannomutase